VYDATMYVDAAAAVDIEDDVTSSNDCEVRCDFADKKMNGHFQCLTQQ
jgi:hypothetical protein